MPIIITCPASTVIGAQKGRKRLIPVSITVSGAPFPAKFVVRVSLISASVPGVFFAQAISGKWDPLSSTSVQTPVIASAPPFPPFLAFPFFLEPNTVGGPNSYNASYQVEVWDVSVVATPVQLRSATFAVTVNTSPAANVNVVFALDYGASMSRTDPANPTSRLARLQAAFPRAVALLRGTDTLAVTTFANVNAVPLVPVFPALASPAQSSQQTTWPPVSLSMALVRCPSASKWESTQVAL
ncbi:MAG: hypothetical protein WDO74_32055 [Pseudomonadota bacterium]